MNNKYTTLAVLIATVAILTSLSAYTVDQRQNAIVFQLGQIVDVKQQSGLYFKVPLLQNIRYFDTRILTLDPADPDRYITAEKKNVLVDYFVKWRIADVKQYYVSVAGDETRADTRLQQTINDGLRAEIGKRSVHDVVSGERNDILQILRSRIDPDARKIGVQVIDVRIKQVALPSEVSDSVYKRMEAERKRVANELRSTGSAEAEKIKADADRQREVIVAEAWRDAQQVKGEGDAAASAIYAAAFSQNPEFYNFYRSLNAYQRSFTGRKDVLILDPHAPFFRYMNSPDGKGGKP